MLDQELRKKGIGGSEVAAILGMDDFSSPYRVWLDKTGRESSSVENKYTESGLILESAVAEFFERRTKYRIIKASANQKTVVHPDYPFVLGTPDRLYMETSKIGKSVLECKTTQYTYDDVPDKWFMQLQWYLGILGLMSGAIAWLEHGLDFKYKEYEFDREFFEYMLTRVRAFWFDHVVKNVPPEPINSTDIERMFARHRDGAVIQATDEIKVVHAELVTVKETIKVLETRETQLTESLKMVMRDNEAIMAGTKPIITWRTSKPSMFFDTEKLKVNDPDVYNAYISERPGSRRFLVKPITHE